MSVFSHVRIDRYAHNYDAVVNRALAISGEDMTFFAKGRILFSLALPRGSRVCSAVRAGLRLRHGDRNTSFSSTFWELKPWSGLISRPTRSKSPVEPTPDCAEYKSTADYAPSQTIDLAFCNGVFHYIQPERRAEAARYIASCVRPGGLFALWENNTRNPGVRHVMSRHPFDRDAIPLCARARGLTCQAGLDHLRTDYCFFFPRFLSCLARLGTLPGKGAARGAVPGARGRGQIGSIAEQEIDAPSVRARSLIHLSWRLVADRMATLLHRLPAPSASNVAVSPPQRYSSVT